MNIEVLLQFVVRGALRRYAGLIDRAVAIESTLFASV